VLALGCSAGDDVPAPAVSAVVPDHASPGVTVMIVGDYFCQQPETGGEEDPLACANMGAVLFGTTPATVAFYAEQMISVEVPPLDSGKVNVAVSVAGRHSNSVAFVVDAP
jgi:hypothetical protein